MLMSNSVHYLYDKIVDIELIFCNNSVISYPLHNHVSVFTIGLVLYGSIALTIGEKSCVCKENHTFTILPYTPHIIKANEPYSLLTLCINKNVIMRHSKEEIKNNICRLLIATSELHLNKTQIMQLTNSFDYINGYADLHFNHSSVDFIREQLECSPEKQFRIEEMADIAYISKYHFIRNFKQAVGLTPHQFQIQNRIRKAQHMLNNVENITEVALATGFCDQSHFIKYFEKYVGLTPTEYKTACRLLTPNFPS